MKDEETIVRKMKTFFSVIIFARMISVRTKEFVGFMEVFGA